MASQMHALWISRNKDHHGHDTNAQYKSKLDQTRREVSSLYVHIDQVLPQDSSLFCSSLDTQLLQPLSQLQRWLTLNKPLIFMSVRQAKDMALKGTLHLDTFFVKVPPTRS